MNEPVLNSLVYVSSEVKPLNPEEISYLLNRARTRNSEYDVTGVLLYISSNFMQYLEGPEESLDFIFKLIQKDDRHTGVILVDQEEIESRQFGDWSMAYQTRDVEGYVGSPGERKLIEMLLDLPDENPSSARIVLNSFWNRSFM